MDWRPMVYGVLLFPVVLVVGLVVSPLLLLVAGFLCGLVAGTGADRALTGLACGLVTGCAIALLAVGGSVYLVARHQSAHGTAVGFHLAVVFLWAVLLAVESTIGGALGGYVDS